MVDFQQFPNQFVELLNLCQSSEAAAAMPGMGAQNAFLAVFELSMSGDAQFKIVQTNQFKASDHLRLRFKKGNDEAIKKFLSEELKNAKVNARTLNEKALNLESVYVKQNETNEQLMYDIQQLREENRRVVDQMKIEEQKKINDVKEKMLLEQSEMQARNDADKKDYNMKSENQISELQEKVMQQADQIQSLQDMKRDLETENKEQAQKISQQLHELDIIRNEIKELRDTNKGLDTTKFSQQKSITEYTLKHESIQRELEDRNQTIVDLKAHLKSVQEAKDKQDNDLKDLK